MLPFEDSTLRSQAGQFGSSPPMPVLSWLFPTTGPVVHALEGAAKLIGRDPSCAIRLESRSVSRRHAEIYRQGPILAIKDLDSKNGVYVEGRRVTHAALKCGQLVRIGDHVALFSMLDREQWQTPPTFSELAPGLLGGAQFSAALRLLRRAASDALPIILQGETGTGKEVIARSVHLWSGRPGPFYAVNCAAIPESMIEAELFGYRKGAFTGAAQPHQGHIRAAHEGTLFLDEILDLPLAAQAKLLRVIEQNEVTPLGETRAQPVDLRLVCACQDSLQLAVERGAFRADLHARLNGYTCNIPPLRERREDVTALFAAFMHRFSGGRPPAVDAKLIERLCLYQWPQNVRELELLTRSLLVLHGDQKVLHRDLLPGHVTCPEPASEPAPKVVNVNGADRDEHDLGRLVLELKRTGGNVARAAASAGVSRQRAYRLMGGRSVGQLLERPAATEELQGNASASGEN